MPTERTREARIRRFAKQQGLAVRTSHKHFAIFEAGSSLAIAGHDETSRFTFTLEDAEAWLDNVRPAESFDVRHYAAQALLTKLTLLEAKIEQLRATCNGSVTSDERGKVPPLSRRVRRRQCFCGDDGGVVSVRRRCRHRPRSALIDYRLERTRLDSHHHRLLKVLCGGRGRARPPALLSLSHAGLPFREQAQDAVSSRASRCVSPCALWLKV
jgi:hypothetical protein